MVNLIVLFTSDVYNDEVQRIDIIKSYQLYNEIKLCKEVYINLKKNLNWFMIIII